MHIIRVSDSLTEEEFIRFPSQIYKDNQLWVRPLEREIKKLFNVNKNPFFENGEAERWILTNFRGRMIGRIAAFVYHRQSDIQGGPTGGIGLFECIHHQPAAFALFDQCKDWLSKKGVDAMNGPVNLLSMTSKWGLLTDGFAEEPAYGMPYHPAYYQAFFENYGFSLHQKLYNYTTNISENFLSPEYREKGKEILSNPDYRIASVSKLNRESFAHQLEEVYNDAWKEHTYFSPMTPELAHDFVQRLVPVMDKKIIYFVYHKDQPVAFFLNLPQKISLFDTGNNHSLARLKNLFGERNRKIVALMMGIKKAQQGKGIDAALAVTLEEYIRSTQGRYKSMEIVGVSDADSKISHMAHRLNMKVSKVFHTYRYNFFKNLAPQHEKGSEGKIPSAASVNSQ